MKLVITDSSGFVDKQFGEWLLDKIILYILSQAAKYNFSKWDKYINTTESFKRLYTKHYKCHELVKEIANSLTVLEITDGIEIRIDPNNFLQGFDRIRLETFGKLLNYGTLTIKGTSLFTDSFNYFEKNIKSFFNTYYLTYLEIEEV